MKHMWESGEQPAAFECMKLFAPAIKHDPMLAARAYQKLGAWQQALQPFDKVSCNRVVVRVIGHKGAPLCRIWILCHFFF